MAGSIWVSSSASDVVETQNEGKTGLVQPRVDRHAEASDGVILDKDNDEDVGKDDGKNDDKDHGEDDDKEDDDKEDDDKEDDEKTSAVSPVNSVIQYTPILNRRSPLFHSFLKLDF